MYSMVFIFLLIPTMFAYAQSPTKNSAIDPQKEFHDSLRKEEPVQNQPHSEMKELLKGVQSSVNASITKTNSFTKMDETIRKLYEEGRPRDAYMEKYLERLKTTLKRCNWDPNAVIPKTSLSGRALKVGDQVFDINPYGSVKINQFYIGKKFDERYDDLFIRIMNELGCKRESIPTGFVLMNIVANSKGQYGATFNSSSYDSSPNPAPELKSSTPLHENKLASLKAIPQNGPSGKIEGYKINSIVPSGFAERNGLKVNDVILSVNKMTIDTQVTFDLLFTSETSMGPLALEVRRDGKVISVPFDLKK